MSENANGFEELLRRLGLDSLPTYQQILESMDPLSWTLVLLLTGAVILGVFFYAEHAVPFSRVSGGRSHSGNPPGALEAGSDLLDAGIDYQPARGRYDVAAAGTRRPDCSDRVAIDVEPGA